MAYLTDEQVQFLRGSFGGLNLGVFFYMDSTPDPLHLWLGAYDRLIKETEIFGITSTDPRGTVFQGVGKLQDVPELELLVNGLSTQVTFQLAGIPSQFLGQFYTDAPSVTGAYAALGIAPLDDRFQPQTDIIQVWSGTADYWTVDWARVERGRSFVCSLSLSLTSGDPRRARPRLISFTSSQQQIEHPSDEFFDHVPRYYPGLPISWPRF